MADDEKGPHISEPEWVPKWALPPQLECQRCHHHVFGLNRGLCYHCVANDERTVCDLPHICPVCGTAWGPDD